ncbi:hypothetical protein WA026_023074 [Henosepilachna vigintioctopunctata]|uniref:Uncharacterized protein n=1 Tax=Henosepilachna vigintioctopunctata TaxID=420089 RepID=A0AAW1V5V2_9CUCU
MHKLQSHNNYETLNKIVEVSERRSVLRPNSQLLCSDVASQNVYENVHMKAMTPGNICTAFKATGIFPFDRNVFTDLDFAPSEVTDRQVDIENNRNGINTPVLDKESTTPSLPILELSSPGSPQVVQLINPADPHTRSDGKQYCRLVNYSLLELQKNHLKLRLPQASPRKSGRAPRRRGKSMITTDTPNKNEIQMREKKKWKETKTLAKTNKRKVLRDSSSENEDDICVYSEEEPLLEDEEDDYAVVDPDCMPELQSLPKEGDFIIVKFQVKGKGIYYIANVIGEMENETEVRFLRRSNRILNNFSLSIVPDIATVGLHDIKMILPKPKYSGNTKRKQWMYYFEQKFSKIDLRKFYVFFSGY